MSTSIDPNTVRRIRFALHGGAKSIGFCDGTALVEALCDGKPGSPPRPALDRHNQYDAEDFAAVIEAAEQRLQGKTSPVEDLAVPSRPPKPEAAHDTNETPATPKPRRRKKKASGQRAATKLTADDGASPNPKREQ